MFSAVATCTRCGSGISSRNPLKRLESIFFKVNVESVRALNLNNSCFGVELTPPKMASISSCEKSQVMYWG